MRWFDADVQYLENNVQLMVEFVMSFPRSSGLLLHISSLPGPYGIGDLGPEAYAFADFLHAAGQTIWQILPIVPVGHGYSPYSSPSTFAGNTLFISPDLLVEDGLLSAEEVGAWTQPAEDVVDFRAVSVLKNRMLETAWKQFNEVGIGWAAGGSATGRGASAGSSATGRGASAGGSATGHGASFTELRLLFKAFCVHNAHWLDDYALFEAIKREHQGAGWTDWSPSLRDRDPSALAAFGTMHGDLIDTIKFSQFLFDRQWAVFKTYCAERDVRLFGDLPIYVAQDSADVWANRDLFYLDASGSPTVVSGVPPDYFSETGQRWGNPLYRWDVMKSRHYAWWVGRMRRILTLVDLVRLDHFRGFAAYWEVPATEETAINGEWRKGPGSDLFRALQHQLGALPVIAENLGVITEDVTDLMAEFGFPGMAILQFAFDSDENNPFLPHNYSTDMVAYTGTHDNDTLLGWWNDTSSTQNTAQIAAARAYCAAYLGLTNNGEEDSDGPTSDLNWKAIEALMKSKASMVVTPMQDVLALESNARMNTPGTTVANWSWRMKKGALSGELVSMLGKLTAETYR